MVVPVVLTVGKQVFLCAVTAITTVMPRMTPAMTTVKKAAVGGKKSPAGAGTKTAACGSPSPALPPRGGSPFSLCLRWLCGTPSPWGGLGRGFWVGGGFSVVLTLNTIIPASTWTDGNDLWINYEKCIDAAMLNSISGECSFHWNGCWTNPSQ